MGRRTAEPDPATAPADPWERWSAAFASIWLVFLVFPLVAVWNADGGARVVGLAGVLAFAVAYVAGFVHLARTSSAASRVAWAYLAALVVLAVVVAWAGGPSALGVAVFVVCFAMFTLPLRVGVGVLVAAVALCLAWPWALGVLAESWFVVLILLLVGVSTGAIRWIEDRQEEHRGLVDQMALVAERERVARDVHDVLGHSLTVLTIKAELAERLVDTDPAAAKREVAAIRSLTREALGEIRATVGGLRIARLGDELDAARQVLADAGVEADLPSDASSVDPRHRLVLAWALREAVTNVVRHSGASRCSVLLAERSMRVLDDGCGVGDAAPGNGLRGLRERVAASGGAIELGPGADGRGTMVEVRW